MRRHAIILDFANIRFRAVRPKGVIHMIASRRDFLRLAGAAAALPLASKPARAQKVRTTARIVILNRPRFAGGRLG
jgi:hypothetical protein